MTAVSAPPAPPGDGGRSSRRERPQPAPSRGAAFDDWPGIQLALAGWLATLLCATALRPLIQGLSWVTPTIMITAAIVLTGVLVRRFAAPLLAPIAQIVVMGWLLIVIFTRSPLPTPGALSTLRAGFAEGLDAVTGQAAPVEAVPGFVLLITVGIALVALLVDLLAATLHHPAAAGLPLLAIFCVPAAVLDDGVPWRYFLLGAIGYLVLISTDALDRIRSWGMVLSDGTSGSRLGAATQWRGGRRVALIALLAAVLIPMITPGLNDQLLNTGEGNGRGRGNGQITVVNPILTLRQNLVSPADTEVITYTTTVENPAPLRIASDEEFDGRSWAPKTGRILRDQRVQDGLPSPPGLSGAVPRTMATTNIAVGALSQTYLPVPYPATKVQIDGDWLYETGSLNIVGDGQRSENTRYTVEHLALDPTVEQLQNAPAAPNSVMTDYTKLPNGLSPLIEQTARARGGDGSNYERALALQDYLRSEGGFVYDLKVTQGNGQNDSGADAVTDFLRNKRGYCVQFASAMAVMARTLDIPARVAVGFLPGDKGADNQYRISLQDAHAWPELYFEGVGWVRFEPTPSTRAPSLPGYADSSPAPESEPQPSESASAAPSPSDAAPSAAPSVNPQDDDPIAAAEQESWWQKIPWQLVAGLLVLALLALVPMITSRVARTLRWRRARTASAVAESGWDDLRERLGDLGIAWDWSWTPRTVTAVLQHEYGVAGSSAAALKRLTDDLESSRYAPPGAAASRPASAVRKDVDEVAAAVGRSRTASERRQALLFPRSGLDVLTGADRRRIRQAYEDASTADVADEEPLAPTSLR